MCRNPCKTDSKFLCFPLEINYKQGNCDKHPHNILSETITLIYKISLCKIEQSHGYRS